VSAAPGHAGGSPPPNPQQPQHPQHPQQANGPHPPPAGAPRPPQDPGAATAKPAEPPDFKSWLRDRSRVQDAAEFAVQLEQAQAELSGRANARGRANSSVFIVGETVSIGGHVTGGDSVAGHAGARFLGEVVTGEVPPEVLAEIKLSFLEPPVFGRLRDMLQQRSIALFQAPAGWGRTTIGLRALHEVCPDGVWKLNPDSDLRKLNGAKTLQPGRGYLLEIRAVDQFAHLKVPHLEELSEWCLANRIRILITADLDIGAGGDVYRNFGVRGDERPDPHVVLRRHLDLLLSGHDAGESGAAARVLADEQVQEILETVVDETVSMRLLAELAQRLAQAVRAAPDAPDYASVAAYFGSQADEDFSDWFAGKSAVGGPRDRGQWAFLLALATLNGMPYATVARAARMLEARIRAVEDGDEEQGRTLFGVNREERLADARAQVVTATTFARYGPMRIEAVRFKNSGYPYRVLDRVWAEYDEVHPLIEDWLRELGGDRDRAVRIRAATAVGLLAAFDFDRIVNEILLPWADSEDEDARESAVSALSLTSLSPELFVHILRMLKDWGGEHSPPNRQWTAARALGASVGRAIRPEAIRILRAMAQRDDLLLHFAIADSMLELFLAEDESAQADVLTALVRWTGPDANPARRAAGVLAFLQLAASVEADDPRSDARWPGLLWLAAREYDHFDPIARLWPRAIQEPGYLVVAQDVFSGWIAMADDPSMIEVLSRLLRKTVKDGFDVQRYRECVTQAALDGETEATRALGKVIDQIGQRI